MAWHCRSVSDTCAAIYPVYLVCRGSAGTARTLTRPTGDHPQPPVAVITQGTIVRLTEFDDNDCTPSEVPARYPHSCHASLGTENIESCNVVTGLWTRSLLPSGPIRESASISTHTDIRMCAVVVSANSLFVTIGFHTLHRSFFLLQFLCRLLQLWGYPALWDSDLKTI